VIVDQKDRAAFDAAETKRTILRESTIGQRVAEVMKTGAQETWSIAGPGLELLGRGALEVLKDFAMSQLTAELERLAGGRR
jgi:hypothetical protein